jgi:hypothetical protein
MRLMRVAQRPGYLNCLQKRCGFQVPHQILGFDWLQRSERSGHKLCQFEPRCPGNPPDVFGPACRLF